MDWPSGDHGEINNIYTVAAQSSLMLVVFGVSQSKQIERCKKCAIMGVVIKFTIADDKSGRNVHKRGNGLEFCSLYN